MEDTEAWIKFPRYRVWYNKLELAQRLRYKCAPHGIDPKADDYPVISKPIYNLYGMGIGVEVWNSPEDIKYKPGYFWEEKFEGSWISYDIDKIKGIAFKAEVVKYEEGRPVLWQIDKVDSFLTFKYSSTPEKYNVETIGGKIIEIHPRWSPDWESYYHRCPLTVQVKWSTNLEEELPSDWIDTRNDGSNMYLPIKRLGIKIRHD